ncbi:MAG: alpha-mannosidase [Phycisphaerae bacterium]|nr:alpha-mannosidase [Phycisphaerae bacterium]
MSLAAMKKLENVYRHKINRRVKELQSLIWTEHVNIDDVAIAETMDHLTPQQAAKLKYKKVKDGHRWGKQWGTGWFRLRFVIPKEFAGKTVSLIFDSQGDSLVFRDNKPIQGLDWARSDVIIEDTAKANQQVELYVEGGANHTFGGFQLRTMNQPKFAVFNQEVWTAYHDVKCLLEMVNPSTNPVERPHLPENDPLHSQIIYTLNKAVDLFDWQDLSRDSIVKSAKKVSSYLKPFYKQHVANASAPTIATMGHAHIDVAWLWPLRETMRKCGRSFSNVLDIMDRYPEFVFCQSQPQLYEYTRDKYPTLYERIKDKVKKNKWVPTGAAWVEMDCNIPSGESLVRQLLFGTRFFKEEFNYSPVCLWLPDVFGYAASLPQILKLSGIDNFLTQKISWNQFTRFPHHSFNWTGIDGSTVLSHFLPGDDYNCNLDPTVLMHSQRNYRQKDRSDIQGCLFGHGDGGGGPTKEMAERQRRYKNLEAMPKCEPMTPKKFFTELKERSHDLPQWVGELYLEIHRGTLTTQANNKKYNRLCENLMRCVEYISAMNLANGGKYAQDKLNEAWKLILLNQFHDIIPGSSIKEVYADSDRDYAIAINAIEEVKANAVEYFAKNVDTTGSGIPVVALNDLSWQYDGVIAAEVKGLRKNSSYIATDIKGNNSPVQVGKDGKAYFKASIPSMGHTTIHINPGTHEDVKLLPATTKKIENENLSIKFDAKGRIKSIVDKNTKREAVKAGCVANQFLLFEDKPNDWDAWDIDIFYNDKMLCSDGELLSMELTETGPVRSVMHIKRKISKSIIAQDIILKAGSGQLDFVTSIQWGDEKDVLLKVAFPTDIHSETARYEIQFGNVTRPTHWNRPQDFAMFEVPGQKWVDLSQSDYGLSMLNDGKYGYDIKGDTIRMSLLRAPKMPDTTADVNKTHCFTYSIRPHGGDFTNGTVRAGYELNNAPLAIAAKSSKGKLPASLSNMAITGDNVIIDTVKKCEDDNSIIVRLYEAHNCAGQRTFSTSLAVKKVTEVNLMEKPLNKTLKIADGKVKLTFSPYQIRTLKLTLK